MKLKEVWKSTRKKKRHAGSAIVMVTLLAKILFKANNLDVDTFEGFDELLDGLLALGGLVYTVGIADYIIYKILPITCKLEKMLEAFNLWAKKLKPSGK